MTEELPDTQTQTQPQSQPGSQDNVKLIVESQKLPPWGRLLAVHDTTVKTLGVSRHSHSLNFTHSVDLVNKDFKFGRSDECDYQVQIGIFPHDVVKNISKVHFILSRNINEPLSPVILYDLSFNGTFVNGEKIGKGNSRILETNDVISVNLPTKKIYEFMDLLKNEQGQVPQCISGKYFISTLLGHGACGIVKLVYNKLTCKKYAMKIIHKKRNSNGVKHPLNDPEKIMNEVAILKALKHPFIISTEEAFDTSDSVYIIMELMEGGELFDRVYESGKMDENLTKFIFLQMVYAVKYLHDQGITHRDLKPENVLLESTESETLVKITDFGLSKFVGEENFMKTMCGTPIYVAPEVLLANGKNAYSSQVDIWSLGVILFICLAGYLPFSGDYKDRCLRDQILSGRYRYSPPHWKGISPSAKLLVRRMLTVNPIKRFTISDVLKDPWMQDKPIVDRVKKLMENYRMTVRKLKNLTIPRPIIKRELSEAFEINYPPAKRMRFEVDSEGTSVIHCLHLTSSTNTNTTETNSYSTSSEFPTDDTT